MFIDNITEIQLDTLREIGNIGSGNATTALSTMLNRKIWMEVPSVNILELEELPGFLFDEESVIVGILVMLDGDLSGSIMLLLTQDAAKYLAEGLISGHDSGVPGLDELEVSAITEIGNIIAGSYLASISKLLNMTIETSVPFLAIDMAGAVLSVPAIEFGKTGDKAVLLQSQISDNSRAIDGHIVLIPTAESYEKIISVLQV